MSTSLSTPGSRGSGPHVPAHLSYSFTPFPRLPDPPSHSRPHPLIFVSNRDLTESTDGLWRPLCEAEAGGGAQGEHSGRPLAPSLRPQAYSDRSALNTTEEAVAGLAAGQPRLSSRLGVCACAYGCAHACERRHACLRECFAICPLFVFMDSHHQEWCMDSRWTLPRGERTWPPRGCLPPTSFLAEKWQMIRSGLRLCRKLEKGTDVACLPSPLP